MCSRGSVGCAAAMRKVFGCCRDEGAAKGGLLSKKASVAPPVLQNERERREGLVAEQKRARPGVPVVPKFGCGEAIEMRGVGKNESATGGAAESAVKGRQGVFLWPVASSHTHHCVRCLVIEARAGRARRRRRRHQFDMWPSIFLLWRHQI